MKHTAATTMRSEIASLWRARQELDWVRSRIANRGRCHVVRCDRCGIACWLDPLRAMDVSLVDYDQTGEVHVGGEVAPMMHSIPAVFLISSMGDLVVTCPLCTRIVVDAET